MDVRECLRECLISGVLSWQAVEILLTWPSKAAPYGKTMLKVPNAHHGGGPSHLLQDRKHVQAQFFSWFCLVPVSTR